MHMDPALGQPTQLAREATGRFWKAYWKVRSAAMQYNRGNLDKETYEGLWEDIVHIWVEILFAESGFFGWQFQPRIRA